MENKLKLYIFEDDCFNIKYGGGFGFAIAENVDAAIELLEKEQHYHTFDNVVLKKCAREFPLNSKIARYFEMYE